MKSKNRPRNPVFILFVLLLIPVAIIIFALFKNPQPPELECYEEEVQSMTIQDVSNLLNEELVEVMWLPDNLESTPIVTSDSYYSYSNPYCHITIKYPSPENASKSLVTIRSNSLGTIQLTKMPLNCSWNFTTNLRPTGSDCSFHLDSTLSTLRVDITISSDFTPEEITQILDGMRVVEPISGTQSS